ncbi:unnamed protein product [Coregonus sp. 'balchen']|nr:unnamed protein product [Coregonus sp. 'balchen']
MEGWMRVNVGGSQLASQRLLQLKYPGYLAAVTLSRMEELLHEHSYTATDYHQGGAPHAAALLCQGSGRRGECGGEAGETRPAAAQAAGDKRPAQGGEAAAGRRASG